jgi:hypothetical protein
MQGKNGVLCKELSSNSRAMKKKLHTKFDMEIQATRLDIQITKTLTEATQRKLEHAWQRSRSGWDVGAEGTQ